MALSQAQIDEAKSEARDFLEYSIFVLCQFLSIDPQVAHSSMDIPVDSEDIYYWNYVSLKRQLQALEAMGD